MTQIYPSGPSNGQDPSLPKFSEAQSILDQQISAQQDISESTFSQPQDIYKSQATEDQNFLSPQTPEFPPTQESSTGVIPVNQQKLVFFRQHQDRTQSPQKYKDTKDFSKRSKANSQVFTPSQPKLHLRTKATGLVIAIAMLPVLAVGTATYYFGTQAINKQITEARTAGVGKRHEQELVQQRQLLETLLIGTGVTAMLAGASAALLSTRHNARLKAMVLTTVTEHETQQKRAEQTKLLTDATQHIWNSLKEEDILKTTVEDARLVLSCDRVVVYSLDKDSHGVVTAESVAVDWPRVLGVTIKDPCFEAKYMEKYQNGRITATANIYEAGFTPCYIEQLETLAVKANLVAPILNEGKILGLLVAHQCSKPRQWQQFEITEFAHLASQAGFALDKAKLIANAASISQQVDTETEWTEYFTEVIEHIRASLTQEDILETATEEVRRVLKSDRVVIYGMDAEFREVILYESVAPGCLRALGVKIVDPCFETRYIEKYRNGRVTATDNIYNAGLSPCYIEQLEKLTVKANLVAPILNEGKLLGLLIAHQCSQPRQWQSHEIRWFSQIAMQIGFALDNATLIANAASLRQQTDTATLWTHYFTDTVAHIRKSLKKEDILKVSVKEVRRILECDRVVIYSLDKNSQGVVIAESVAPGWMKALGVTIKDPCFEARYIEQYQNGRVKATDNIYQAGLTRCYIEQLEKLAVKANLVAPILTDGKILGLLVAHQCSESRVWQQHQIRWFSQIATQVGFALDNAKLLEKNTLAYQEEGNFQGQQFQPQHESLQQLAKLLKDRKISVKTLSSTAVNFSETLAAALSQIQEIADATKGMVTTAEQAKLQVMRSDQTLQQGQETVKQIIHSVSDFHEVVTDGAAKAKYLSRYCQKLSDLVCFMTNLIEQMNSQTMNVTIAASKSDNSPIESMTANAEKVRALRLQLLEVIAEIQPLIKSINIGTNEVVAVMEAGTQQVVAGKQSLGAIQQQIDQITITRSLVSQVVEEITQAAANQTQTSHWVSQSILAATNLANQTSKESLALTESLTELVANIDQQLQES